MQGGKLKYVFDLFEKPNTAGLPLDECQFLAIPLYPPPEGGTLKAATSEERWIESFFHISLFQSMKTRQGRGKRLNR